MYILDLSQHVFVNLYLGASNTASRGELVNLTQGEDVLHLSSAGPLFSDAFGVEISWSGFYLDSVMSSVAAFSVALSTSQTAPGLIVFDIVLLDTHSGWMEEAYRLLKSVDLHLLYVLSVFV